LKSLLLLVSLCLFSVNLFAGESQFGLVNQSMGNLVVPYSASGKGRSFEIAHMDSLHLNLRNFATMTNISQTTFSFNLGYNAIWAENRVEKTFFDFANFQGVSLAIPLQQKIFALGFGIHPYTSIEQRVQSTSTIDGDAISQNVFVRGGLGKANFNLAYKFSDNLSVGLGYEYTFGKISEQVVIDVEDNISSEIEFKYDNKLYGNGLVLSLIGSPLENVNIGVMTRTPVFGKITQTGETLADALNSDKEFDVELPSEYNIGIEYLLSPTYIVGLDFIYQDWEKGYLVDDKKIAQHNSYYHIGAGVEKKGSERRFVKYSEQIDYRLGVFYSELAHLNNNEKVNEYGISAGLSLPIQKFQSKIDLAGFIAKRGNLSKNILEEIIFGFGISINANELWFVNIED